MKKRGNVFLPQITNAIKRVQMKMIQKNFQQRIKNNDYNYVQTHQIRHKSNSREQDQRDE